MRTVRGFLTYYLPRKRGTHRSIDSQHQIRRPLQECWFVRDGVRFLRPKMVLHRKSSLTRPKDQKDFTSANPVLGADAHEWLRFLFLSPIRRALG